MSLKARIEAIIYAADEPVTLSQLVDLLHDDLIAGESQPDADYQPDTAEPLQLAGESASEEMPAVEDLAAESETPAEEQATTEQDPVEGELLNPQKAKREENKRHRALVKDLVETLVAEYTDPERGIEIREIAGGYRMSTKPEHHEILRSFAKGNKPPIKLSLPALETLAVIAYKQPVTAPEISEIRGVDSAGVLSSLLGRKLITTAGRKQVVGRPILYKTTKEFLLRFGLKDVSELPSMEEFERMGAQSDMFETEPTPEPQPQADAAIPEDYAESV